jgi:hypothetical protein
MASMIRYRLRTLLIVLALGPPVLAGICNWWAGREPSVEGVVTYRGMPAAAVSVTFVPMSGNGRNYVTTTDATGCFQVAGGQMGRAVRPGNYRVSFKAASLPAKYQNPAGFSIVVTVSGPQNQFNFDLR